MVNAELGGVHGPSAQAERVLLAEAEEEGVRCGQQMANDKVKAILFGFVSVGNQSLYATIKGTNPIIGGVTANAVDPTAKNAYSLNGSQTSVLGPFGTYTRRILPNVKTAPIVYPTSRAPTAPRTPSGRACGRSGVKVTHDRLPPLATDLIGAATQASSADMIIARLGFTDCVPFARAMDQIRYTKPVLSTPLCTFFPRAAYAGGDLPKWTYGIAQTLVNCPGPQAKLYLKKGLQYGTTVNDMLWVFSQLAWEELLATVKIMNTIPYSTAHPRADRCRVQELQGPLVMGAPEVACGKVSTRRSPPSAATRRSSTTTWARGSGSRRRAG